MTDETKEKIANFILGQCDMGVAAELPEEEHIASIIKALNQTPEVILYYLENGAENNCLAQKHLKAAWSRPG